MTSHVFQAFVAMAVMLTALAGASAATRAPDRPSLFAYRGMGTWVDIFDDALWADPSATVQAMHAEGVRTIYLETSNYSHRAIVFPLKVGQFIDSAHLAGMRVVAWYLPSFEHLKADFRKSMAAIDYRSSTGGAFDSFALDIESRVVADPAARTRRLLDLSKWIRDAVGPSYPLGAIIPNPVRLAIESSFWPNFPYVELVQYYDLFLPMCYFGAVANGSQAVHDYTASCIELIRTGVGDATVPIHGIGGVANNLDGAEILAFGRAVRENGLLGGSLYELEPGDRLWPYHTHHANEEWLIVTQGRPTLRTSEGEHDLQEGDVVAFPRGKDGAHQVSNRTDSPIRVLMLSTLIAPDIVEYIDSGKVGARSAAGERILLSRPGPILDYWDGEE